MELSEASHIDSRHFNRRLSTSVRQSQTWVGSAAVLPLSREAAGYANDLLIARIPSTPLAIPDTRRHRYSVSAVAARTDQPARSSQPRPIHEKAYVLAPASLSA